MRSTMKGSSRAVGYLLSWFSLLLLFLRTHIQAEVSDNEYPGVVYDQRQSGKFNIQVSIKDVAIIEMDQNAFDDQSSDGDDYYYDEEDLTVKPLPSWITKPTGVTTPKPLIQGILNSSTSNPENNTQHTSSQTKLIPISNAIYSNNSNTNLSPNFPVTQAVPTASINISKSKSVTTTPKPYSTKHDAKITNNVISSTTNLVPNKNPSSTHLPPISSRSNDIPTQITAGVMSHRKQRHQNRSQNYRLFKRSQNKVHVLPGKSNSENDDTKIYKIIIRRAHKENAAMHHYSSHHHNAFRRRCRSGAFLDEVGVCRMKRAPSILKQLFKMLVSLPLGSSEAMEEAYDS